MTLADSILLERWMARRDAEAFSEIVSRHTDLVYGASRRIVRNDADAQDVVHSWRTSNGLEVDFVLHGERGLVAVEVRSRPHLRVARLIRQPGEPGMSDPSGTAHVSWAYQLVTRGVTLRSSPVEFT
jgi:hypothetical protein